MKAKVKLTRQQIEAVLDTPLDLGFVVVAIHERISGTDMQPGGSTMRLAIMYNYLRCAKDFETTDGKLHNIVYPSYNQKPLSLLEKLP